MNYTHKYQIKLIKQLLWKPLIKQQNEEKEVKLKVPYEHRHRQEWLPNHHC